MVLSFEFSQVIIYFIQQSTGILIVHSVIFQKAIKNEKLLKVHREQFETALTCLNSCQDHTHSNKFAFTFPPLFLKFIRLNYIIFMPYRQLYYDGEF